MFVSGDLLGLSRNSDCISRHIQLIWTLGMQKPVLFDLGNLLGVLRECNQTIVCVSIRFVAPKEEEVPRASQASREGGLVWQAGKA
jgi:hypothetical protein